jgi:catechol 2,3-dioxygenase-like lactoylglutathione lyase family enzyme
MKRLHVHVTVDSLEESIRFYATLFDAEPTVRKDDYAKWMLDDPCVNFAISENCGRSSGIDHLGIQVDAAEELTELSQRIAKIDRPVVEQRNAECCYARGDKAWISDPQGVAWETFRTVGEIATYGADTGALDELATRTAACCERRQPEAD